MKKLYEDYETKALPLTHTHTHTYTITNKDTETKNLVLLLLSKLTPTGGPSELK